MSNPDLQYFSADGTWIKPLGAIAVDIVGCGGGAGASGASDGAPGELSVRRVAADELPDTIEVEVGKGGRPGGRDGYALIITHLTEEHSRPVWHGGNGLTGSAHVGGGGEAGLVTGTGGTASASGTPFVAGGGGSAS